MLVVLFSWLTLGACARVTVVVLCVYLSVTTLTATYLVCKSKLWCYNIPYGVSNAWFVWIHRKRFVSQFWCHLLILSFLTSFQRSAMTWRINRTLCVLSYIRHRPIIRMRMRGLRGRVWGHIDGYACSQSRILLASMVRPAKHVSLSSSQFSIKHSSCS